MDKQEIVEKLYEKKGAEADTLVKERIANICDILHVLPECDIEKEVPELIWYINGITSRLDSEPEKTILDKLKDLIKRSNPFAVECNTVEKMNKKTRFFMNLFLAAIAVIAIAALAFTVLNLVFGEDFLNGWGDKIAGALGTLDFALGALGFIIERKDDMKKQELRSAAQAAKDTGDSEKFAKIVINNVTKNSNNKKIKAKNVKGDVFIGNKYEK